MLPQALHVADALPPQWPQYIVVESPGLGVFEAMGAKYFSVVDNEENVSTTELGAMVLIQLAVMR